MKSKLKIKSVEAHKDPDTSPVLVNFQHGVLQPGAERQFTCIRATNRRTKNSNVLMAANNKGLYKGLIGEAAASDLVNTFIAVRSKSTNKVRLIQVQECHLLNAAVDAAADRPDLHLSKDVYFKNFSGKKGSSYHDRIEKQKMNVDVIKDTIEKSLDNVDEKRLFIKELDLLKSQHENDVLPPMKNSDNPRVAYDLKEIFKEEIFKHLDAVAKAVLRTNAEELPIKCEYILKRIQNVQLAKEPDSPANLDKVKICVYMDALANLLAFGRKNIDSNKELSGLSSPLEQHIRDNFKPAKTSFQNSTYTQAKAHCYFLVLAFLLTDDFVLDVKELVRETSLDKQSVIKYGMYCGARLDSRTNCLTLRTGKKRDLYEVPRGMKRKK